MKLSRTVGAGTSRGGSLRRKCATLLRNLNRKLRIGIGKRLRSNGRHACMTISTQPLNVKSKFSPVSFVMVRFRLARFVALLALVWLWWDFPRTQGAMKGFMNSVLVPVCAIPFFDFPAVRNLPLFSPSVPFAPFLMAFNAVAMQAITLRSTPIEISSRLWRFAFSADFERNCFRHDRLLGSRLCLESAVV